MDHNISHMVMGVFKAFGAAEKKTVRLTKIGCVDGRPPKIPVGLTIEGILTSKIEVGMSFNIANAKTSENDEFRLWCTSIIQEIIPNNTFKTKNSIYKWEII